jgi:hypothetical protein
MSILKTIYFFFHAFFEFLSFKIKPKFDKDNNDNNDYDYEFIKDLNETMKR